MLGDWSFWVCDEHMVRPYTSCFNVVWWRLLLLRTMFRVIVENNESFFFFFGGRGRSELDVNVGRTRYPLNVRDSSSN